jgi:hypothetical protein
VGLIGGLDDMITKLPGIIAAAGKSSSAIFVSSNNEEVTLVIGESNAGDTTAAVGVSSVVLSSGILKSWNTSTSSYDIITTGDMNNAGPTYGTGYKRFAKNRYDNTASLGNRKSCIVNMSAAGSDWLSRVDNNDWSPTGTRRATAVTHANAAMAAIGVNRLRVRITLGTNDLIAGSSAATIYPGMVSVIDWLNTEFHTPKIYITICNFYSGASATMDATKYNATKNFFDLVTAYTNVDIVGSMLNEWVWAYGFGDQNHLTTAGYEHLESQFERAVTSSETDREVRRMQTMLHDEPTTLQKAAIKLFFFTKGYASIIDAMQTYVGEGRNRRLYEWTGYTCPLDTPNLGLEMPNKHFIHTETTTPKYLRTNFISSISRRNTTSTDWIEGFKTGVNLTAAATSAIPMGTNSGATRRVFQTTSSNIIWNAGSTTSRTYTGWTKIPDNTKIAIGRNGTTEQLYGGSVVIQSFTGTAGADATRDVYIGGNGSSGFYIDCQFDRYYHIKNSGTNLATFDTDLDALIYALVGDPVTLRLNFGMSGAAPSVSGWNNVWGESNPDNAAGTIDSSRPDTGNNLWSQWGNISGSGISVRAINTGNDTVSWARAAVNSGQSTGNNSGIYPDLVLTSFWYVNGGQGKLEIYGLDQYRTYRVTIIASRDSAVGGSRRSIFTVNGVALPALQAIGNTSNTVERDGVVPVSGVITILLDKDDNSLAYMNAIVIQEA